MSESTTYYCDFCGCKATPIEALENFWRLRLQAPAGAVLTIECCSLDACFRKALTRCRKAYAEAKATPDQGGTIVATEETAQNPPPVEMVSNGAADLEPMAPVCASLFTAPGSNDTDRCLLDAGHHPPHQGERFAWNDASEPEPAALGLPDNDLAIES